MIQNSILFDIGGTKMRVAFSPNGESFEAPQNVSTPTNYDDGLTLFVDLAKRCAADRKIEAVCGGIAGPFDEKKRSLVGSPNLSDWIGRPFKNNLEEQLQAPIYIENDSAMVALGEATAGAGKGFEIMAYITISTGVGGARIAGGRIDDKAVGFEPGHQVLDINSMKTFQDLTSGRSLKEEAGKEPREVTDPDTWERLAKHVSLGAHNSVVHWSPNCLVFGGSMIVGNPAIPVDSIEKHLRETLKIFPEIPVIKKAELGDFGGLYGALAYLKQF